MVPAVAIFVQAFLVVAKLGWVNTFNLPVLFMGAAVGILPMLLIFFLVQRYIVEGVKTTGIK